MFQQASTTLASLSPMLKGGKHLLPPLSDIQQVSRTIAIAVAKKEVEQSKASDRKQERLLERIDEEFWLAEYQEYKRIAS